jgi:hypothetical protein
VYRGDNENHTPAYPKREPFHAHRLTRALMKTCAAQTIGQSATLLVICIAHTEDAAFYRRAVTFYDSQLMSLVGIASWRALNRARQSAVNGGWLHFAPGGNRKPGVYWTLIPAAIGGLDDLPSDEGSDCAAQVDGIDSESSTTCAAQAESNSTCAAQVGAQVERASARRSNGSTSYPNPIPIPHHPPADSNGAAQVDSENGGGGLLDDSGEWERVEAALSDFGLVDAVGAAKAARGRRVSPAKVREFLSFARRESSRWEDPPGTLHFRLTRANPDDPVDSGWPPARRTSQQSREAADALSDLRSDGREAAAKSAKQRERDAELERRHGAVLEGMTDEERDALALEKYRGRGTPGFRAYRACAKEGSLPAATRLDLLRQIEARASAGKCKE